MLFKNKFDTEYTDMNKNLEALKSAVTGIRDNKNLKELITMILKVGNYLNYGTNKGKAQGFQMELLLQLSNIKGVSKVKMSLLEFMIHSIRKHNPTILKFTSDLVSCELASKIDVSFLAGKVQDLEKGIGKV